jgi:hypothetical protein
MVVLKKAVLPTNKPIANGWINFGTASIDKTPANVQERSHAVKIKAVQAGGCGAFVYLQPGAVSLSAPGHCITHSPIPPATWA